MQLPFVYKNPKINHQTNKLVIFLHGYGANGQDLISLADEFADILPSAKFVSPNAPFTCEIANSGYQWFSLFDRTKEAMLDGLEIAYSILKNFIDEQLDNLNLTYKDLILIGFSQGTMLSLYSSLNLKEKPFAVVGYSGALIVDEKVKENKVDLPKILLIHGDIDQVVPSQSLFDAKKLLKKLNYSVDIHMLEGLGHGIDYRAIQLTKNFLKKYK